MTASSGSGRLSHGPLTLGLLLVACALLCAPAWPAGQTLTHEQLGRLILLPEPEAQRELDDEFQGWSKVLSPSGPAIAPRPYPFKQPESAPLGPVIEPSPYPFQQPAPAPSGPATEPRKQSGAPKP